MNHAPCGVYALIDSSTQEIFYVGSSTHLQSRLSSYDIGMGRKSLKSKNIGVLKKLMLWKLTNKPLYVAILEFCPKGKRMIREYTWIRFCLRAGYPLVNVNIGKSWKDRLGVGVEELIQGKAEALFIGEVREAINFVRLMSRHKKSGG